MGDTTGAPTIEGHAAQEAHDSHCVGDVGERGGSNVSPPIDSVSEEALLRLGASRSLVAGDCPIFSSRDAGDGAGAGGMSGSGDAAL